MANNWQLDLIAGLDGTKSKSNLNSQINGLARNLDKLKLYAEIDKNQVTQLQNQLKNLQVQLNNVTVSDAVINGLVAKINAGLQNVNISNVNIDNIGNQARQTGEKIAQQINQGINSVVQKGSFEKIFTPDKNGINGVAKDAEKYFKTLSNTVSVEERLGNKNNLEGFTVTLKNAEGVVEQLRYKYQELKNDAGEVTSRWFEYSGGSINDNGVIKQMNAISAKADSLQTKLDKLKANYSDVNASRPIKDSGNISALSQQYDKVTQAIENVRSADNATFSSMVSNAQREITTLESMVSQFRNAENVATQMKSVDISSGIAQAQERLAKLKANSSGFEQMTNTIRNLDIAIEGVGDKSSLDKFINDLRTAETQLSRVKAESKQLEQLNKIKLSIDNSAFSTQIEKMKSDFQRYGLSVDEAENKVKELRTTLSSMQNASDDKLVSEFTTWQNQIKKTQVQLDKAKLSFDKFAQPVSGEKISSLVLRIDTCLAKNTKMTKEAKTQLEGFKTELNGGVTLGRWNEINTSFEQTENSMRKLHKLGASLKDQMRQATTSFTQWISISSAIMGVTYKVKEAFSTMKDMDTILTEISKTSDLTKTQLEDLGQSSYDSASKYGRTATDHLTGIQEMSRSGFYGKQGEAMAEQSLLAQSAGDMTSELANSYILATNAAFKYKGNAEKINEVLDGQNEINTMVSLYRNIWLHIWLLSWNVQRWITERISYAIIKNIWYIIKQVMKK